MTVVAYRDNWMSCDSAWSAGDLLVTRKNKITRLASGGLLGSAGDDDCRAIEAELIAGNPVDGKKLVRTKPHRKWIVEPGQIVNALYNSITPRIDEALIWEEPAIKSPAQIEKLGKGKQKTKIKEVVAELAASPLGQLVVADANDPRPEVDLIAEAAGDFPSADLEDLVST